MINNMVERLLPGGEMDTFAVGNIIAMGHETGLSELELQVLLNLFALDGVGLDGIVDAYGMAFTIMRINLDIEQQNMREIHTDADLRNLIESRTDFAFLFEAQLVNPDSVALQQIANALGAQLMSEVNRMLMGESVDFGNLETLLLQTQLVTFLSEVGLVAPASAFNLDNFNSSGSGSIGFMGNPYYVSGLNAITGTAYLSDATEAELYAAWNRLLQENPSLWGTVGSIVIKLVPYISYVPGVSTTVGAAGTAVGAVSTVSSIVSILSGNSNLSAAEAEHLARMYALAAYRLGAGIATVNVPNGYVVVGTVPSPNTVINLAGLDARGFTPERVLELLLNGDRGCTDRQQVINFAQGGRRSIRSDLELDMARAFYNNHEHIIEHLGLDLPRYTPLNDLPADVLEYLLSLVLNNND